MAVLEERFDNLESRFDDLGKKLDDILKAIDCLPDKYVTIDKFRPYAVAMNMIAGAALLAVVGGIIKLISTHQVL